MNTEYLIDNVALARPDPTSDKVWSGSSGVYTPRAVYGRPECMFSQYSSERHSLTWISCAAAAAAAAATVL